MSRISSSLHSSSLGAIFLRLALSNAVLWIVVPVAMGPSTFVRSRAMHWSTGCCLPPVAIYFLPRCCAVFQLGRGCFLPCHKAPSPLSEIESTGSWILSIISSIIQQLSMEERIFFQQTKQRFPYGLPSTRCFLDWLDLCSPNRGHRRY